ncbi:site-specific integrase [Klebsiella pneumoniae]|uniref:site-specific integrase n=1 Tax=Klebsiella pneumoniae TaxID=573 RepID=UPI0006672C38|nr:site-specific integrase [Klebsiella pneumoniae]
MDLPVGVEIHGKKIRISFIYRGTRCREVLQGWTPTPANIRKAGNLRAVIISEIQLGKFDYASHFPESKAVKKFTTAQKITTYEELCDTYSEAKKLEVSNASYLRVLSRISTLKMVVGSNTPISEIQHSDLLRYRAELLNGEVINSSMPWLNKAGRAVSTVNGLMNTLTGMLELAHKSNFIKHAPHEGVKMLKRSKKDPDPLLQSEYDAFMSALPPKAALLWTIAIHTGLRHGELAALAWEDIDLQRGEIRVARNRTDEGLFVPPKTDAGFRTITLVQPALDALRQQFKLTGALAKTKIDFHHREHGLIEQQSWRFVFIPSSNSRVKGGCFATTSLAHSWNRGLAAAGVRARRPYQSRHTFACWMLTAGANPSFIASQMGHANAKMVYEVYGRWIGEMDRSQIDLLNSKLHTATPQWCPSLRVSNIKGD